MLIITCYVVLTALELRQSSFSASLNSSGELMLHHYHKTLTDVTNYYHITKQRGSVKPILIISITLHTAVVINLYLQQSINTNIANMLITE